MFLENVRFPETLALGAEAGPLYLTRILDFTSGHETRQSSWDKPRQTYTVRLMNRPHAELQALAALFRILKGRAHGIRFKEFGDFSAPATQTLLANLPGVSGWIPAYHQGILGTGVGDGSLVYQVRKRYTVDSNVDDRDILKLVPNQWTFYSDAVALVPGVGAGQIAVDTTVGEVTFVPTVTRTINAITKANPGKVTTSVNHGFITGDRIYHSGITGMTELNGRVFTITVVDPDEYTIGINTTTYTTFTAGANAAKKGPQPSNALTGAFQFDVPVRFNNDQMGPAFSLAAGGALIATWESVALIELRRPEL